MEITKTQLIDHLGSLTVMEMAQLTRDLEETWDVSATPVPQVQPTMPNDETPVQTEFDVLMLSFGDKKINVIKVLRKELPGLGLKEAKFMAESVGGLIKEGVSREEADVLKAALEQAGGTVTIK